MGKLDLKGYPDEYLDGTFVSTLNSRPGPKINSETLSLFKILNTEHIVGI